MRDLQEDVRRFCERQELVLAPEERTLDLVSEVGEVAKEMLKRTDYGAESPRRRPELVEELGDAAFSLLALASELEVDLEEAVRRALDKYRGRLESDGRGPGSGG